jgi:hypothetical protein
LTHLVIRGSKIRDQDLALLAELPQLTTLSIMYVPLTDAAVAVLESRSSLRWLALLGTDITEARLNETRGKRPNDLIIEHKSGAFLGISPIPVAEINRDVGLCLGSITAGAAADRAGLLPGDYLLRFDGHPISEFEDLKARIGEKRPGDVVELLIRRGDQEQNKKVILGKWSSSDWWIASMQNRFNPLPVKPAPVPVIPAPENGEHI